jgi:broad specificity phosphatase PhoE
VPTRLIFVRHGQTDSNVEGRSQGRRDVPLNDFGRRQGAALGRRLAPMALSAIVSSRSARAHDTALAIGGVAGLDVQVDERLGELHQGELDGLIGDEMRLAHPEFMQRWREDDPADLRVPGGETLREAQTRMVEAVSDAIHAHRGGAIVFVSHNLALRAFYCHAFGVPLAAFRRLRHDVAALAVIDSNDDGTFFVVNLNERCHLDDPRGEPLDAKADAVRP